MKKSTFLFLVILVWPAIWLPAQDFNYTDSWGNSGFTLLSNKSRSVSVNFSIEDFQLVDNQIDGQSVKNILMKGALLPNDAGAPDIPGFSRYIAIPEGASVTLEVVRYRTELLKNIELAPAPVIPKDNEDGPLKYAYDERIFGEDAFFPADPFKVSPVTEIRGVDAVLLGITPFQYNPVSKELIVYRDVEVELKISAGNGIYGEERLRSRWFDPILRDVLLNYSALPEVDYSKRPKNNTDNTGYEYLIVIPDDPAWMPFAEQIRDFRIKQGISTGIVTLNDIGGSSATVLESYFNNAYNTWNPAPVAVLLMADYGSDASNSIISPIYNSYCASDNIFADVNNNDMPDMIFARMTAQNATHLQTMVSKMISYETNPPVDFNFYNKPITALGWQTERWFQICSESVGGFWREVQDKNPVRINAIYSGTPGSTWSTATNTSTVVNYFGPSGLGYIPATPAELGGWSGGTATHVINAINDGAFALQHRDHGGTTGWGEPDFHNSHINSLNNTQNNELVFVFSINCLTGKYNMAGECFTEKFHRHTYNGLNAGALGLIAASEVSYSFVNDTYVWGMLDNMEPGFMPDYGMPVDERGFMPAFGNAAGKYFLQQSGWPYNTNNKKVTYNLFHHHGGAFLTVYTEVPQNLSVTHSPVLLSGETNFSVTANAGSLIALTTGGEVIGLAEGTGGPVNIPVEPQIPPTEITVTVTKQNYFRYESTVEVVPPSGPYVIFEAVDVNDGSKANGNGQLDFGESVSLHVTLKNVGSDLAGDVSAALVSADPFITISDDYAVFGDIPAGGSITLNDAFALDAGNNLPDGHLINFTVEAGDGSSTWNSYFSLTGHAPDLNVQGFYVDDAAGNNNGILDPGETAPVMLTLVNDGGAAAENIHGTLATADPYLTIETANPQAFGALNPGETSTAPFTVTASASIPGGYLAEATLTITAGQGIEQQDVVEFNFSDYCYPGADCSFGDGFTGFALEQINNMNSGCSSGGYGDFTNMVADLEAGQTYTVSWKTGYSNQDACLWIDLNNNREFEDSERLITDYNLSSVNTVYNTTFTLPDNIYPGNKRMRIRANWQNSAAAPCSNFSYGETEDYTVNVQGGAVVADFNADQTTICEGGEVSYADLSAGQVINWEWSFPGGNPATSVQQNPVVTYSQSGVYDVVLTVQGQNSSDTKQRSSYIEVIEGPGQPAPPQGMTQLCYNPGNTLYSIEPVAGITEYQWSLTPSNAGEITGTSTYATVNWNNTFAGSANVTVQGIGACGPGIASEPLTVTIQDIPAPAGTISGESTGCVGEESLFNIPVISGADEYEWILQPEHAGSMVVNNNSCTVTWDMYFEGTASVSARGLNNCGTGEWSPAFDTEVGLCAGGLPDGWDYNPTPLQHTILIPNTANLSVFGNPFLEGDYIGVFYLDDQGNEKCGGAIEWTLADNTTIMAFGDDFSTPEKDGFANNEEIIWKVFCWNVEEEYALMPSYDPGFPQVTGQFVNYGVSGLLSLEAYITSQVQLSAGWNGMSMPVTPFEQDVELLFGDVADDLIIMLNNESMFWPSMNVNTFTGWDYSMGAAVKMVMPSEIAVAGIPPAASSLSLPAGWSYLPVPVNCAVDAAQVFAAIHNQVEIVKEVAGYRVYWPAMNIFTLQALEAGKAYFIKLSQETTIEFPACTDAVVPDREPAPESPAAWGTSPTVPGSHLLAVDHQKIDGAEHGDFLGAFTAEGQYAGSVKITDQPVVLSICGDDPSTAQSEGFAEGGELFFRILRQSGTEKEVVFVFDETLPDSDGTFTQNGLSAVKSGSAGASGIANAAHQVNVYPNPATDEIMIEGISGYHHMSLSSVQGFPVKELAIEGREFIRMDLTDLSKGIYFLRFSGPSGIAISKVVRN
ncbi:MAG: C25 family cysteine peptidase [Bacteroidales bacterium]